MFTNENMIFDKTYNEEGNDNLICKKCSSVHVCF